MRRLLAAMFLAAAAAFTLSPLQAQAVCSPPPGCTPGSMCPQVCYSEPAWF